MSVSIRRLALAAVLAATMSVRADDPPKPPADAPKPADETKPADTPKKDTPKPPAGSGVLNNNTGPSMHSVGKIEAKLSKADGSTVTIKLTVEDGTGHEHCSPGGKRAARGGQMHPVAKDVDYDLAADAKVRWKDLPKGPDGKAKQYTKEEYQKLLDPPGTPGYKADQSDLHAGQTVRLYLSKPSNAKKDDKPVVTTVMILVDAPKSADGTDKPKKK